jgi:hypothetical protein
MATKTRRLREAQNWALYSDWCASVGAPALPTTAGAIAEFLAAFPAPIEEQGRRVRAIRRAHESAGATLVLPTTEKPSALRNGGSWTSVPRALAQVPKYHHPKGIEAAIRGRRDGWLLVLVGVLGLSRNDARLLGQDDVEVFPRLTIKNLAVPRNEPPAECPACAVTRWFRIAGAASFGFWKDVQAVVTPVGVDEAEHDCATGLDGLWRQADTLLPAVDRHGWVSSEPMSTRAVSAAMARRQTLGPVATIAERKILTGGRYDDATMDELADAYDDVDRRVAAALLQIQAVVGEGSELLEHLKDFG